MKCPDKDDLMLYVENELSSNETEAISKHLSVCSDCTREVQMMQTELADELVMKKKFNSYCSKHSQTSSIMAKIKSEPLPKKQSSIFNNWLLKFMAPALALALLLCVLMLSNKDKAAVEFSGRVSAVSINAYGTEAYIDDEKITFDQSYDFSNSETKKLKGEFLIKINTERPCILLVKGDTTIGFDEKSGMAIFNGEDVKVYAMYGDGVKARINNEVVTLAKPREVEESDEKITIKKENTLPKKKDIEKEEIKPEAQKTVEIKTIVDDNQKEDVTVRETSSNIDNEEEVLTSSETGDITEIEEDTSETVDENINPFAEQKLGGIGN